MLYGWDGWDITTVGHSGNQFEASNTGSMWSKGMAVITLRALPMRQNILR